MRKSLLFCMFGVLLLVISCGGGSDPQPVFEASIFSDQPADGDIAFDPVLHTFTINQSPVTLFFGIDDNDVNLPEYRAFLDFPLDGSTGQEIVPANAAIISASLEVFVTEVSFAPIVPTLLDLVSYPINGLRAADFDSAPLLTQSVDFFASDLGNFVRIDITSLMKEAQRLGLTDLQIRFILDFVTDTGLVGIEDHPAISLTAPLLIVHYVL